MFESGNRANVHLHPRPAFASRRIVAVEAARIAAVGIAGPDVVRNVRVAVHVIPTRIDQHAVVGDAGMPFVRFVIAQADDVAAVGPHRERGVHGAVAAATQVAAAALGDERDPAVGQHARIEIVPVAVGQLDQARAVGVDFENVVRAFRVPNVRFLAAILFPRPRLAVGKQDRLAVPGDFRRQEAAAFKLLAFEPAVLDDRVLQQVDQPRMFAKRILQHEQPAAGLGVAAVVLIAHVVHAHRIVPLEE